MRQQPLWQMGGPFRALIMDIRCSHLLHTTPLHRVKDMLVWEIVELAYLKAEQSRAKKSKYRSFRYRQDADTKCV